MHLSVYPWNNLQPSTPPHVLPYGEELISKFGWLNDFFYAPFPVCQMIQHLSQKCE